MPPRCRGGPAASYQLARALGGINRISPLQRAIGCLVWLAQMPWERLLKRGDVDADSIPSQRANPALAAERCDGCDGAGPTGACQALFRGSHEALRARRGPVVGCVALWSDGDR